MYGGGENGDDDAIAACFELDASAAAAADAGVNTITVPSTVVLKLRNPRTVTVGSSALTVMIMSNDVCCFMMLTKKTWKNKEICG